LLSYYFVQIIIVQYSFSESICSSYSRRHCVSISRHSHLYHCIEAIDSRLNGIDQRLANLRINITRDILVRPSGGGGRFLMQNGGRTLVQNGTQQASPRLRVAIAPGAHEVTYFFPSSLPNYYNRIEISPFLVEKVEDSSLFEAPFRHSSDLAAI
jgi:hypothetical protein